MTPAIPGDKPTNDYRDKCNGEYESVESKLTDNFVKAKQYKNKNKSNKVFHIKTPYSFFLHWHLPPQSNVGSGFLHFFLGGVKDSTP